MKSIVFKARSQYARFRCAHTTTSALTYTTVHPPAVRGMIGAILGVEYNELFEFASDIKIGIQVIMPVNKDMQSFNLIAMAGNNNAANFQSRVQFLRDVEYRLFVSTDHNKLKQIANSINNHNYIFTPYLGCSEHIARLDFEGTFDNQNSENEYSDTIIPKEYAVLEEKRLGVINFDRIPVLNNKEREYIKYCPIVFSPAKRIKTKECKLFKVGKYNVFYF